MLVKIEYVGISPHNLVLDFKGTGIILYPYFSLFDFPLCRMLFIQFYLMDLKNDKSSHRKKVAKNKVLARLKSSYAYTQLYRS